MIMPIVKNWDKKHYKKCIHCRQWKPKADREFYADAVAEGLESGAESGESTSEVVLTTEKHAFGRHDDNADGLQVICMACKNIMGTRARNKNPVQRIRHHTGTRCLTQLGDLAPANFVANLETHLGYKIARLVRHLGADLKQREGKHRKLNDALNEGYHIDHKHPLSKFQVVVPDDSDGSSSEVIDGQLHMKLRIDWEEFRRCWAMSNLSAIPAAENLAKGAKVMNAQESPEKFAGKGAPDLLIVDDVADVPLTEEQVEKLKEWHDGRPQTEEVKTNAEEKKVTIDINGPSVVK